MTEKDNPARGENPLKWMLGLFLTIVILNKVVFPAMGVTFTDVIIVVNAIFIVGGVIYLLLPGERGKSE